MCYSDLVYWVGGYCRLSDVCILWKKFHLGGISSTGGIELLLWYKRLLRRVYRQDVYFVEKLICIVLCTLLHEMVGWWLQWLV